MVCVWGIRSKCPLTRKLLTLWGIRSKCPLTRRGDLHCLQKVVPRFVRRGPQGRARLDELRTSGADTIVLAVDGGRITPPYTNRQHRCEHNIQETTWQHCGLTRGQCQLEVWLLASSRKKLSTVTIMNNGFLLVECLCLVEHKSQNDFTPLNHKTTLRCTEWQRRH